MDEPQKDPVRIVVMSSGQGAGLQALLAACRDGVLNAEIVALAADKKCPAIRVAEDAPLPIIFHPWGHYRQAGRLPATYDRDLAVKILLRGADYVVFDGWRRPLSASFFEHFPQRAIYLHHGLRGRFPGTNAAEDAIEAFWQEGIPQAGVSVLFTSGGDIEKDPLIRQAVVPIMPGDTLESLSDRMRIIGTRTLIEAVRVVLDTAVRRR
jgi:phosphoribosylglycinamide formyltransferase-1